MAIAYDNSSFLGSNGGSGNFSASYTGATLTNGLLVAGITGDTTTDSITAVTYDGAALTLGAKLQTSGGRWIYCYYLLGPASGSKTFAITQSGGGYLIPVVAEYSGVKQSGQPDATATNSSGGSFVTSLASSITIANANSWSVLCAQNAGGTYSNGTGAIVRVQDTTFHNTGLYDSNADLSTGSNSMTVNISPSSPIGVVLVSFQPAVASSAPLHRLLQMGVG